MKEELQFLGARRVFLPSSFNFKPIKGGFQDKPGAGCNFLRSKRDADENFWINGWLGNY